MYVRWKQKRLTKNYGRGKAGGIRWRAELVECVRVDGKPRQKHIAALVAVIIAALLGLIAASQYDESSQFFGILLMGVLVFLATNVRELLGRIRRALASNSPR